VNNDNDEKISKGLLGTGTQMPSPSPSYLPPSRIGSVSMSFRDFTMP